jgi:hypothetical protein
MTHCRLRMLVCSSRTIVPRDTLRRVVSRTMITTARPMVSRGSHLAGPEDGAVGGGTAPTAASSAEGSAVVSHNGALMPGLSRRASTI